MKRRVFFAALLGGVVAPARPAALSADTLLKAWTDKEGPPGTGIGLCNGINAIFTLSYIPDATRTHVYLNGMHQRLAGDYTLSGKTLTFLRPPSSGDTIDVDAVGRFNV